MLVILGLSGDCWIGGLLLAGQHLQLLALHPFTTLIWAGGIDIVSTRITTQESTIRLRRLRLNRWSATALCLGLLPFPGCATLAYTIALIAAKWFRRQTVEEVELEGITPARPVSLPLDLEVQPLVDILESSDLQMRRAAVSVLSQQANPESIRLLRGLLLDPQAELCSDASIALTRIEEQLAHVLNDALARWNANPESKERTLDLADQYYAYACSNVLDEESQRAYLTKACELVQQCLAQDDAQAALWLRCVHIKRRLGQKAEALTNVLRALELESNAPEIHSVAMELAFEQHAWDTLLTLAHQGQDMMPDSSGVWTSLQSWGTYAEARKEVFHDAVC